MKFLIGYFLIINSKILRLVKNAVLDFELEQSEGMMDLPKTVYALEEGKNLTTVGKNWT